MRISVIIPALNEAASIEAAIKALPAGFDEVLVADGGSTDDTRARAEAAGAKVIASRRGRGPQMNAGAAAASGDVFLFHHADTRLPDDAFTHVRTALSDEGIAGGAFHLAIEGRGWFYSFTARNANIRSKLVGAPYGDQSFFVRRGPFEALRGYRDFPTCEDLDFIRRLRSQGRVVLVPAAVWTSARRWEKHGRVRITVRNGILFFKFWLGLLREREAAPGEPPAVPAGASERPS